MHVGTTQARAERTNYARTPTRPHGGAASTRCGPGAWIAHASGSGPPAGGKVGAPTPGPQSRCARSWRNSPDWAPPALAPRARTTPGARPRPPPRQHPCARPPRRLGCGGRAAPASPHQGRHRRRLQADRVAEASAVEAPEGPAERGAHGRGAAIERVHEPGRGAGGSLRQLSPTKIRLLCPLPCAASCAGAGWAADLPARAHWPWWWWWRCSSSAMSRCGPHTAGGRHPHQQCHRRPTSSRPTPARSSSTHATEWTRRRPDLTQTNTFSPMRLLSTPSTSYWTPATGARLPANYYSPPATGQLLRLTSYCGTGRLLLDADH